MNTKPTALVTGASRGIGREIARELHRLGFRLALMARNTEELKILARELQTEEDAPLVLTADVTSETAVNQAFEQLWQQWGRLDVLVLNAGIGTFKPMEEIAAEEFDRVLSVNLKGLFLCCKAAVPNMRKQGSGQIVGITSDVARRPIANGTLYCASKYGQEGFLASLRKELRPEGIRVTTLYPGITATDFDGKGPEAAHKQTWMKAKDVAQTVGYAVTAPDTVVIDELMIHPSWQEY